MITPDDLLVIAQFADLPFDDRSWLAERMEEGVFDIGDQVHEVGAEATDLWVVLEGAIRFDQLRQGRYRMYQTFRAPRITGLLPYSRMTHLNGRSVVLEHTRIAILHKRYFRDMLYRLPEIGNRLVALLSDRVRDTAFGDQQREKLVSLGRLSAGMAHEINNPAGAVARSVPSLHARLRDVRRLTASLVAIGIPTDGLEAALAAVKVDPAVHISSLAQSDAEEVMADALAEAGIEDPWTMASSLAEMGVSPGDVHRAAGEAGTPVSSDLVEWLVACLDADRLIGEIETASKRITDLVSSVKAYSRMDRDQERQIVEVAQGIDSTLKMLGPRLKERSIQVELDSGDGIPDIQGLPGELNQVWTNLVENAVDAMAPGGRLRISLRADPVWVIVEVEDDGEGIPEDAQDHIFEPFFTTKPVGKGTGLGLEIAYRIVVVQHGGSIRVESRPGRTVFTVALPISSPRGDGSPESGA